VAALTVGLAQINNSFSGHNYLPYSAALLQAHVQRHAADPGRYRFLLPLYRRQRVDEAVAHLIEADVVGFSTYVWNIRLSLEIARRVKAGKPRALVIFGGPQVPDQPERFLREHPFVDVVVHNEGEAVFLRLLETYPRRDWADVSGISFLCPDGALARHPNADRLRDLSVAPSPYLDRTFASLMAARPEETWIALWETNRGCPFACTFCDWGSATASKVTKFDLGRLRQEVDWFAQHRIEFVFCCDANFGILPRDVEIARYVAETKERHGFPRALSVQNTKNATERAYQTQKILADAGLNKGVALSLQSVDTEALKAIKRQNISLDTYLELQRRFTRDRVETYSDLILGLPGETYDAFVDGVARVIESGQHNRIQFNNCSILPNAEMADPRYRARYGLVTVECPIVNIHGALEESEDGIHEVQELVVATDAMPAEAWCRARAFAWMTALLHFDKLLQIPLVVLHALGGIGYRRLIEAFMGVETAHLPLLGGIRDFFVDSARAIQAGGPEYVYSREWLGIYWPADEYVFIKLTAERSLDRFYGEARAVLEGLLATEASVLPAGALDDAVTLNRSLVKQPHERDDVVVRMTHDILAFYRDALTGTPSGLRAAPVSYVIDRSSERWTNLEAWSREVVWYGNKKGAYLYGNRAAAAELAGHY